MRRRRVDATSALAASLAAAIACGPAHPAARPALAPGRIAHYRPLELQRDARLASQAVVLGTDDSHGSTVLALPARPTTLVVDAPVLRSGAAGPPAAMIAIALTSTPPALRDPADTRPPSLAFPADAGRGEPAAGWRAGAWAAAVVAAAALGKDLSDVSLSVAPAGSVEATGSALLAAGFAAALVGDTVDPAATLLGAIEPDGTLGPVAALPDLLAAAIAGGKTRIGYPRGMRLARSAAGTEVDLEQLARARHAEAIELGTVHDAYRLLTGHRLAETVPVRAAAMALDPDTLERLDARYVSWQHKLAEEWAPLLQLEQAGRMPAAVIAMLRVAHERGRQADARHRAGDVVAAYGDLLAAWLHAAAANRTHEVLGKLAAGDPAGAEAALAAIDPGDDGIAAPLARLVQRAPATLAGQLAGLQAQQTALRGLAYHALAVESRRSAEQLLGDLAGLPPAEPGAAATREAATAAVARAVLRMLRAVAESAMAEQELALAPDDGVACLASPAELGRSAEAVRGAARAAVGQLDALLVEPLARSAEGRASARWRVAAVEPDFLIADQLSRAVDQGLPLAAGMAGMTAPSAGEGARDAADPRGAALLELAAAQAAYHSAQLALARHASLAVHLGDAGRVDAVGQPRALAALLAGAERAARAAAHAAQVATGAIPVQVRLAYQVAVGEAAGGLEAQLDALAQLWSATAHAQAAVTLARSCQPAAAAPRPAATLR